MNQKELAYQSAVDGKANSSHTHSASQITSGTLPVSRGGTGRSTLTSGYFLRGNGTGAVTMSSVDQVKSALGMDSGSSGGSFITWYGPYSHTITLSKTNTSSTSITSPTYTINIGGTRTIDIIYVRVKFYLSNIDLGDYSTKDDTEVSLYLFFGNYPGIAWNDYYQVSLSGYQNPYELTTSTTNLTRYRTLKFNTLDNRNVNYPNPSYLVNDRLQTSICKTESYISTENRPVTLRLQTTVQFMIGTTKF